MGKVIDLSKSTYIINGKRMTISKALKMAKAIEMARANGWRPPYPDPA